LASIEINRFEQADVKIWGFIAVGVVTSMVLLTSIANFVPSKFLNGLRETRNSSGTINQLQAELTSIRLEFASLKRANSIAGTRLTLGEESSSKFSRRVRALESTIPMLMEALPADATIDRSLITASINEANGEEIIKSTDEVKVVQSSLFDNRPMSEASPETLQQALPEKVDEQVLNIPNTVADNSPAVQVSSTEFGLIIGPTVTVDGAPIVWQRYKADVGTLLIGLEPRLLPINNDSGDLRLIAGPISDISEAISLCLQISRTGVTCEASGFGGVELSR
jgi:hypothetical protein